MRKQTLMGSLVTAAALLGGCGGGNSPPAPKSYRVGGTVSGLTGTGLVLQDNGTDNLTIMSNGSFIFPTSLTAGQDYSVTVSTQPTANSGTPPQTCFVTLGIGISQGADAETVVVACLDNAARFAYVVDGGSNAISGFSINNETGALTAINGSPFPAGTNPISLTVHPSRKFAYASNGDNTISEYTIDSTTGALASISGSPLPIPPTTTPLMGYAIMPVVIDASGKLAFVANPSVSFSIPGPEQTDNLDVYSIDATTGALTAITGSPLGTGADWPSFVAINSSDTFAYVVNGAWQAGADQCAISVFSIDPNAASIAAVAGSPFRAPPTCRASAPSSFLLGASGEIAYLTNGDNGGSPALQWLTLDSATGAIAGSGQDGSAQGASTSAAAIDPSGRFLYLADPGAANGYEIYEYSVDATSGGLTAIGSVPTGAANSVAIAPTGKFLYVANTTSIYAYSIDSTTGALTAVSGSPFMVASSSDTIAGLIAIDPSGRFTYVASSGSNAVYAMGIDQSTGALSAVSGSPFPTGSRPGRIAFLD